MRSRLRPGEDGSKEQQQERSERPRQPTDKLLQQTSFGEALNRESKNKRKVFMYLSELEYFFC